MNSQVKIEIADVMGVYSGKAGKCMCGCSGKYFYATAHQLTASKDRGYAVSDDELGDKMIKRVVNKVNAVLALDEIGQHAWELEIAADGQYVSITQEGRRDYVVYFTPETQAKYAPEPGKHATKAQVVNVIVGGPHVFVESLPGDPKIEKAFDIDATIQSRVTTYLRANRLGVTEPTGFTLPWLKPFVV